MAQRITAIAFGDLFPTDVRAYRERQLQGTGLEPLFPIWGQPTRELAQEMVKAGLRAKLVCVDPKQLPASFVGRDFDQSLLDDLPAAVIPAGKRRVPFVCLCGPMFKREIAIRTGEKVERDGFWFVTCFLKLTSSRSQGNDPQRTAGAIHDLQRCGNHHGAHGRKLVKVAEPGQPELAAAVHDVVIGKRRIEC